MVGKFDKIDDKESNTQLKSKRKFANLLDDSVCSTNRLVVKYKDDKQIEKELEWDTMDNSDSVNIGREDVESDVEWKQYV